MLAITVDTYQQNSTRHEGHSAVSAGLAEVPEDVDMAIAPFPLVLVKDCPFPEVEADDDEPEGIPISSRRTC